MNPSLPRLQTDLGERSIYDAASQCSRCGYCEQACPTYVASGSEAKSPRGRNQALRLLLEGKLKDPASAREAFATCLLCGACSSACYAHIPTAELVLEGRRMLEKPSWLATLLTGLLIRRPALLERLLKAAYAAKRLGLSRLARPLLRGLGLSGLAVADAHVSEAPATLLAEQLRGLPQAETPAWHYFAPCGPNFLYPRVGLATVGALSALRGPGRFLDNPCCGLLPYNYGSLDDSRELARRNIARAEEAPSPDAPVVADCSSCAAFLKSYPQLFLDDPEWRPRAEAYSRRVRDAVEAFAESGLPRAEAGVPATYHDSCRARHGQGVSAEPRKAMAELFGEGFRELPEADVCCGGAGAFAFAQPELSDQVLRRKIGRIAETGARLVAASSTSCLLQLAHGLKKYYPECRVAHLSEIIADTVEKNGKKARA